MRAAGDRPDGVRLRTLIVMLWRAGLRISEALALAETDLDRRRGAVIVRRGKGGRRREIGMDRWAWEQIEPSRAIRCTHPPSWGDAVPDSWTDRGPQVGGIGRPQAANGVAADDLIQADGAAAFG